MPHSTSPAPPDPPRRLLSPQERFGGPPEDVPTQPQPEPPAPENPETSMRRDDEMARRHLPPRERFRQERAAKKRASIESKRRRGRQTQRHQQRAEIERDFAVAARVEAPKPAPRPRRHVPKVLKRILALVCLLFCLQLGVAAFTAPQFQIQSVVVSGFSVTPREELEALSARLVGQNWLRANRMAVENAARRLPAVASARVVRLPVWPPQVELQVTERVPVLKVGAGNDWWVADVAGVPFRRAVADDEALYSVVAPQFAPQLGQKLEPKLWASAVALNGAISKDNALVPAKDGQNLPFWQLRRIYFDKHGQAALRLRGLGALAAHNEMLVRLGDDQWSQKLARARVVLEYFERTQRKAQELDLVSLERPVWRPIAAQIAAEPKPQNAPRSSG
jgi:cell division septal protein FtsQ